MSEIINVPMVQQRDIQTVTTEIRTLTKAAQRMALEYGVEIGRRLHEAKEMLPHGQWGEWLKNEVEFSQSTANNFMRLFDAYADDQITLDGAVTKSQALGNLSITKALRLLALPEEDREEFIESHDMEGLSTRELERLLKEKQEAERQAEQAREERDAQADALNGAKQAAETAAASAEAAKKEAQAAQQRVSALEAALEKEKGARKKAADKLKELQENPEVAPEVLEKLRAEAAEAAERDAAARLDQELAGSRTELERLRETAAASARAEQEAREKLEAMQKRLQLADPDMVLFKQQFEVVQEAFNKLLGIRMRIENGNPENGQKLKKAIEAMVDSFKSRV